MWSLASRELRELAWLALMILGLSTAGVGLSAVLALALIGVP